MASGTADLQRDLGGAIMQSILGALLTVGYAASTAAQVAASPQADKISASTEAALQKSFSSAEEVAAQYPQYAQAIENGARVAFLQGANWAYAAGILAIAIGALVTWWRYPGRVGEQQLLAEYAKQDAADSVDA